MSKFDQPADDLASQAQAQDPRELKRVADEPMFAENMTLRDYFAGHVLGLASHDLADPDEIAARAYAVADAMIRVKLEKM